VFFELFYRPQKLIGKTVFLAASGSCNVASWLVSSTDLLIYGHLEYVLIDPLVYYLLQIVTLYFNDSVFAYTLWAIKDVSSFTFMTTEANVDKFS